MENLGSKGEHTLNNMMLSNLWIGFISSAAASLIRQVRVGRYAESIGKPGELCPFRLSMAFATFLQKLAC